jgi:hypothetical protein
LRVERVARSGASASSHLSNPFCGRRPAPWGAKHIRFARFDAT